MSSCRRHPDLEPGVTGERHYLARAARTDRLVYIFNVIARHCTAGKFKHDTVKLAVRASTYRSEHNGCDGARFFIGDAGRSLKLVLFRIARLIGPGRRGRFDLG